MRLRFVTLLACIAALSFGMPGDSGREHTPYSAIVVFGTSLSDSGNAFALRGGTNTPPDYLLNPCSFRAPPTRAAVTISATGPPGSSSSPARLVWLAAFGRRSDRTA